MLRFSVIPGIFYFEWIFGGLFGEGLLYSLRDDGTYVCDGCIVKY